MRRFGRRLDVERLRAELPLVVRFFDCLRLDTIDRVREIFAAQGGGRRSPVSAAP
jgi:DNA ligase-1